MLDLTNSSVLVTGGAGFIGCALSQVLATRSGRYVVVDVLHRQVHGSSARPQRLHDGAELVVADVSSSSPWLADLRPDVVVHLAAETGTAQSLGEATRHANVNVVGTTRLLDQLGEVGHLPRLVVVCSSRAVYGEGRWLGPDGSPYYPGQRTHGQLLRQVWDFPESSPLPSNCEETMALPTSVYGATKLAQEHLLAAWCGAHDVSLRILRLQNVFGPGQSLINSYTGIVSLFSQLARDGKPIPLYEDGLITRDFVYIDDVVSAIVAAIGSDASGVLRADVGSGAPTTLAELASTVADLRHAPAPEVNGMFRDGDVRYAACSIARTTELLGWRPTIDLRGGLMRLQDWIDTESPA